MERQWKSKKNFKALIPEARLSTLSMMTFVIVGVDSGVDSGVKVNVVVDVVEGGRYVGRDWPKKRPWDDWGRIGCCGWYEGLLCPKNKGWWSGFVTRGLSECDPYPGSASGDPGDPYESFGLKSRPPKIPAKMWNEHVLELASISFVYKAVKQFSRKGWLNGLEGKLTHDSRGTSKYLYWGHFTQFVVKCCLWRTRIQKEFFCLGTV